jgi:signal transduction histidine kinase
MNRIYSGLSTIRFLRNSYTFKFLFVAFLGIHIPLIGLIIFVFLNPGLVSAVTVSIATLIFTLAATGVTLYILRSLLEPLHASSVALDRYLHDREIPSLPQHFNDEAGILMRGVQATVESLDRLLEEKKDLVGFISHDLRTPLATVVLLAKQLERAEDMNPEQRKKLSSMIITTTNDQIALFRRVLELLRSDDVHNIRVHLDSVDVRDLLSHSIAELRTHADLKNIRVNLDCERSLAAPADKMLLTQVMKNLIGNAIKFSHADSEVRVAASSVSGRVRIAVTDQGTGFNPEDAPDLFQRFTPKRRAGTANEVSTGMGLYLSQKFVRAHNGTLSGHSKGINMGSVFTVEL